MFPPGNWRGCVLRAAACWTLQKGQFFSSKKFSLEKVNSIATVGQLAGPSWQGEMRRNCTNISAFQNNFSFEVFRKLTSVPRRPMQQQQRPSYSDSEQPGRPPVCRPPRDPGWYFNRLLNIVPKMSLLNLLKMFLEKGSVQCSATHILDNSY